MRISVAIMAHLDRRNHAEALNDELKTQGFIDPCIVYDNGGGEWDTGKRSLECGLSESDWHIVLQDDAIIGSNFYTNVNAAIANVPQQSLISLYTGKVRPFATHVSKAIEQANVNGSSWLVSNRLMWGVGIIIPSSQITPVLNNAKTSSVPYDQSIGLYYFRTNKPVYYTHPSIVDHNHNLSSLAGHNYSGEPRVAHKFIGDDLVGFNNKVERIMI